MADANVELYATFEVTHFAEIFCHFRIDTEEWIVQGTSVEAQIALTIVV